jgi:hypothetical protein
MDETSDSYQEPLFEAKRLFNQRQYFKTLEIINAVKKFANKDENSSLLGIQGQCLYHLGKYRMASECLFKSMDKTNSPSNLTSLFYIAKCKI